MKYLVSLFALLFVSAVSAANLDIYWIDVEGGAATLIVTPSGETVLMDAGWPGFDGRDPKRIVNVLKNEAGKQKIDYFITSHFHRDHAGGIPELARMVEIVKFVDHGDSVEKDSTANGGDQLWADYLAAAKGKRMTIKPGDKLPVKGVDFLFVAARSRFLAQPVGKGGKNPACEGATLKELDEGENGKSVGFLVTLGNFEFLDLGDLSWNFEHELACPVNLLGEIDLYQVTHHGMHMSGAPQHIQAIRPKVAVMNNGPRKGGTPQTYEVLSKVESLQDLWQVHRAVQSDEGHNTNEKLIANLGETDDCEGRWIKASVAADGSYTVTNSRNGFSKSYQAQ